MTSILCFILLFIFTLNPQADLFGGGEWWSYILAIFAILFEAAIITGILLLITQSKCQTEIFATTMKLKNKWRHGVMNKQSIITEMNICCKQRGACLRIITFPFVFIPILGGSIYSFINATFIGWDYMDMYFDSINLPIDLQKKEIFGDTRSSIAAICQRSTYDLSKEYTRFGFIVSFLETIPIVGGTIFPLVNACACALFACDIEDAGGLSGINEPNNVAVLM